MTRPLLAALATAAALLAASATSASAAVLTVNLSGTGSGTVTSAQAGTGGMQINCTNVGNPGGPGAGVCAENYPDGLPSPKVNLTATPAVHPALFEGWTGSGTQIGTCKGGSKSFTCEVTVNNFTGAVTAGFRAVPDVPVAVTQPATAGPVPYTLTMNGTVDPEGEPLESCRFEYDTEPYAQGEAPHGIVSLCEQSAAEIGAGSEPVAVSAETAPLEPETAYHFRFTASNPGGSSDGGSLSFTGGPIDGGACNSERRQEQGVAGLLLPECMALEMVSPPKKDGQPANAPAVAADGGRVQFRSSAALAGTPVLLWAQGDPYIATRSSSGWSTDYTSQPGIYRGWYTGAEAVSFTPELDSWLRIGGDAFQYYRGAGTAFKGSLGGGHTALSPLFERVGLGDRNDLTSINLAGASADQKRLYFITGGTSIAYNPPDPQPSGTGAERNTYIAGRDASNIPDLVLLARDRLGKAWGGACGSHLGGSSNRGAVSPSGDRVYFSTRPDQPAEGPCQGSPLRILERLESAQGPWIGELISSECDRPGSEPCKEEDELNGDDVYRGASVDQSKVYFTTPRQLADTDTDETADLYLYDADLPVNEKLIQVSVGEVAPGHPTPGSGAKALGSSVTVSGDGSRVYFAAEGVLSNDESPTGASPLEGQPNLYVWERASEELDFIGTLATADGGGNAYPVPLTGKQGGVEVGGEGHTLLFYSKANLSEDDEDAGFRDVFSYDANTETIELLSAPQGASGAPADVETHTGVGGRGGTDFAEQGRWVSEDGETVLFRTTEKLLPGDINGVRDTYLWRGGELFVLPGTGDPGGLNDQAVLSHDGHTVAFQTFKQLVASDGDLAMDVYAARLNGGFEPAPEEPVCVPSEAGECQDGVVAAPVAANSGPSEAIVPIEAPAPPNPCARPARRAKALSNRAKALMRKSRRAAREGNRGRAKGLARKSRRLAKGARKQSQSAKRCRARRARADRGGSK